MLSKNLYLINQINQMISFWAANECTVMFRIGGKHMEAGCIKGSSVLPWLWNKLKKTTGSKKVLTVNSLLNHSATLCLSVLITLSVSAVTSDDVCKGWPSSLLSLSPMGGKKIDAHAHTSHPRSATGAITSFAGCHLIAQLHVSFTAPTLANKHLD